MLNVLIADIHSADILERQLWAAYRALHRKCVAGQPDDFRTELRT